jgi:hypothetical protein
MIAKPPTTIQNCHHVIVFNLAEATRRRDETPEAAYREELDTSIAEARRVGAPYVVLILDEKRTRHTVPARRVFAQIWEGSAVKEFDRGEVYALLRIPTPEERARELRGHRVRHVKCELDKDYNLTCKR